MKAKDLTNIKFNMLSPVKFIESRNKRRIWLCKCDCGLMVEVRSGDIISGKQKSCGCLKEFLTKQRCSKHKHAQRGKISKTYTIWMGMKQRCRYKSHIGYKYYGGRGVDYCERWESFENFLNDMGECPYGKTLDRINPFANYSPDNCRWATWKEQRKNTRANYVHNL